MADDPNETPKSEVGDQVATQDGADNEPLEVELSAEDTKALEGLVEPAAEAGQEAPKPERTYTHKEYVGLQRGIEAREREITRLKAQVGNQEAIDARLKRLEEAKEIDFAYFDRLERLGRGEIDEEEPAAAPPETPLQRKRREWQEAGKSIPAQAARQMEAEARAFLDAADKAGVKPIGYGVNGVPIFSKEFNDFFRPLSGAAEALEKLPEFVAQQSNNGQGKEGVSKVEAELQAERAKRKELQAKIGYGIIETGGPRGPGGARTLAAANERYRKGETSFKEFQAESEEIRKQGE